MQPGLEKVEKTNSFMNKKTFLKEYDTLVNTLRVITLVTLSKLLYLPTYLAHNSFHLHNNPDDKCSGTASLGITAVSIGTALVGIFCTFVNVYKTVYGQSMVIFIKRITHEN